MPRAAASFTRSPWGPLPDRDRCQTHRETANEPADGRGGKNMTKSTPTTYTTRRSRARRRLRRPAEAGQATAEYALVLLGVAFIAVLVLDWARNTNMIGRLLNTVFKSITKLIT